MNTSTAEFIGKSSRALKHCDRLLKKIEKTGEASIKVNATGLTLPCHRGDALHTLLMSERARLYHEINSFELTPKTRMAIRLPAPVGACDKVICPNCGKEFSKVHHAQKYCGDECRIAAHKANRTAWDKKYREKIKNGVDKSEEV